MKSQKVALTKREKQMQIELERCQRDLNDAYTAARHQNAMHKDLLQQVADMALELECVRRPDVGSVKEQDEVLFGIINFRREMFA